jgi:hypothetical protein
VARFLIGALLGFVAAHMALNKHQLTSRHLFTALALFLIAMAAPHFDGWLARLTGFKASVLEFQLAGTAIANHKIAIAERLEDYSTDVVLQSFIKYPEKIQNDLDYIEHIELKVVLDGRSPSPQQVKLQKFVADTRVVKPVFETLFTKLAQCLKDQIEAGMNVERAREGLRSAAYKLQQIVLNQARPEWSGERSHTEFWDDLLVAPSAIDKWRLGASPPCACIAEEYKKRNPDRSNLSAYPRISKAQGLPYLYSAAAMLLVFVGEYRSALDLLEVSRYDINTLRSENWPKSKFAFDDYRYLSFLGILRQSQGQPAGRSVQPYEEMRNIAYRRQEMLRAYCAKTKCDDVMNSLIARERSAELLAMNNFSMFVAEDLARGLNAAKDFEVMAESYANKLKEAVDMSEGDQDERDAYTDTYAYTLMAIEAQRPSPNRENLRKLARTLEELVERYENNLLEIVRASRQPSQSDLNALTWARIHYNSARELAGD